MEYNNNNDNKFQKNYENEDTTNKLLSNKYNYKQKKERENNKHQPNKYEYLNHIIKEIYNLTIKQQILIFSILCYTLLIIAIIFLKSKKIDINKKEITDNIYITVLGNDYLHDITETYKNIHSISFDRNMTHFTKGVNFLSIFTKELNRIKANPSNDNDKENFIIENSIGNLNYNNLNIDNTRFSYTIDENEKKNFFKENKSNGNYLLFPVFYSLIPNVIFDAEFNGLTLEKVYFIDTKFSANTNTNNNTNNCKEGYFSNYFNFPKYKKDDRNKNFYLMDEKVDPHSKCEENYAINKNKNDNDNDNDNNNNNFFAVFEEDFNNNNNNNLNFYSKKILNQIQIKENNMKYTNLYSIIMSNKFKEEKNSNSKSIFSIGFNFLDNFSLQENNQNDKINHFSIAYFENNLLENKKYNNTMITAKDKLFKNLPNYDIVNGRRVVISIPPFMENLYIYGFNTTKYFKEYKDDLHAIVSTEDLFAYGNSSEILNLGFEKDSKNFNLLGFLFKQIVESPSNTCGDYSYDMKEFGVLDEEECFSELCFFNDCIGTENIFNSSIFHKGFINCKCIPLFCGDKSQKIIAKTEKDFEDYKKIPNYEYENNLIFERYNKFQKLKETLKFRESDYFKYIKKNNKPLQCKINYEKETFIDNDYINDKVKLAKKNFGSVYLLDITESKMPFFSKANGKFIVSYFINLNEFIYELYSNYRATVEYFNSVLLIIYAFLICLSSTIFFYRFIQKIDAFKKRIEEITEDKILKKIFEINSDLEKSGRILRVSYLGTSKIK